MPKLYAKAFPPVRHRNLMLSCSAISTDCHTIYIILYLDSSKYVCASQAIHFQYLSAVYFVVVVVYPLSIITLLMNSWCFSS